MKKQLIRALSVVMALAMLMSAAVISAGAEGVDLADYTASDEMALLGQSYEVVDVISQAEDAHHTVTISVEDPDAVAAAIEDGTLVLSLDRNNDRPYLDEDLYPNQSQGGALDTWMTEGDTPQFTDVSMSVSGRELTVEFDSNCIFYAADWWDPSAEPYLDYSVPHTNGGYFLDTCGYFTLHASIDEEVVGSAELKIAPYDNFHTMDELYVQEQEIAERLTAAGLYASYEIMGYSTAGRPMPYLVIADSEESVTDWLALTEAAETEPTQVLADIEAGEYDDIRVPAMYTNIHSNEVAAVDGIIDFAWMLVDALENNDGMLSYTSLTGFTAEGEEQLAAEMEERGNVAVPDLVADKATYLGWLQDGNGQSGVVDMEKYYTEEEVEVSVADLLQDVFLLLVPEENVDGRTYMTRHSSNGYDLNRDNSFQTTSETAAMQQLIGTYNPVSLTEFHGRIGDFQCEPCDPPHEPNFEYDLLAEHLIAGGEALGIAAVASNDAYNSYVIPQRDYLSYTDDTKTETYWNDPWDDMSTSYTPQFAMLQGSVAYTVELPAYDDNTADLVTYGILGQADYIASDKIGYLTAQVEIYERGVNNANSDAYDMVGQWLTDQADVEGAEMDLFRPEYDGEGQNGNFFPECYIIPLDGENQANLQAAADMLVWLSRNDVKISLTADAFTYDGVTYPAGTAIVTMYQAKRSVANGALYDGTPIHSWTVLYSEGITSFGDTRGFDVVTVAEPASYEEISAVMGEAMDYEETQAAAAAVTGCFTGVEGKDVIISNVSEDSTSAVNALLQAGKTVGMVTEGDYMGDFICSYEDYQSVAGDYVLTAAGVDAADVVAETIGEVPCVYIPGIPETSDEGFAFTRQVGESFEWNYDRCAMELMNFNTTEELSEANVIAGAAYLSEEETAAVQAGMPYIGYGSGASFSLAEGTEYTGLSGAMDCKEFVVYPETTLVNASYVADGDDILYGYGYGYFTAIPDGAVVLAAVDGSKEPEECFIPTDTDARAAAYEAYRDGGILGFQYSADGMNIVLFANTLTNKVHQRDEYAYISNFIFSQLLSGEAYPGSAK